MFGNTCAPFSVECSLCKTDSNESVAKIQGDIDFFTIVFQLYACMLICYMLVYEWEIQANQWQGLTKQQ